MADLDWETDFPFDRTRLSQAQRRRTECLFIVHRVWPSLAPSSTVTIAQWLYRGEARIKLEDQTIGWPKENP